MNNSLTDLTVKGFLDTTAGKDPVPGGGSISALCGSIAAALTEMVAGLTIGKKKYAEVEEQMKQLAANVPMEVARRVYSLLSDIEEVVSNGNQNAVTDGCVAMMSARNAIIGALFNVRINLTSIKDEQYVADMTAEADRLEREVIEREAKVIEYTKEACK